MFTNTYKGLFVTFDGPNGSGKSTIITEVSKRLLKLSLCITQTKEPTQSRIGQFTLAESEFVKGNALACLVSADRYNHICERVIPALKEGNIVLCDRYLVSSLILQYIDGVNIDYILKLNSEIIIPDIFILLYANELIIQQRLSKRQRLSRFEKDNKVGLELESLFRAKDIIHEISDNIYTFDTSKPLYQTVDNVSTLILSIYNERNNH